MAKAKLHELIAVEGDLEGTAKKIIDEAANTFKNKDEHFLALRREVKMLADTAEARVEETSEGKELVSTVFEKLDYVRSPVIRYWDAVLQKEATNQTAKADLVVDGKTVSSGLPATFLLGMENKLKSLRAMYESIPTHPPGRSWIPDVGHSHKNVYVAKDDEIRVRTKKLTKPVVLYEATKDHPAQVKEVTEDVPVGQVVTRYWSGMISPAEKSDILARIDVLLRSVKKARQRANSTEVVKATVGKVLIDFINTGVLAGADAAGDDVETDV